MEESIAVNGSLLLPTVSSRSTAKTPFSSQNFAIYVMLAMIAVIALLASSSAFAQSAEAPALDVVTMTASSTSETIVRRTGTIIDYTGRALRLQLPMGNTEDFPSSRVKSIAYTKSALQKEGESELASGNPTAAIDRLRLARRDESRAFVNREITATMVNSHLQLEEWDRAGEEFRLLLASDPTTLFLPICPVAWKGVVLTDSQQARMLAWAESPDPITAVMGASYLLAGRDRASAMRLLETLSAHEDPRASALAWQQRWRTQIVTATSVDVDRWKSQLQAMPLSLQGVGWYVIGEALARLDQPEEAAIAYLRVALLQPDQQSLAADSLLAAGKQLAKLDRTSQSFSVWKELVAKYPATAAAREAKERLAAEIPEAK